MPDGENANEYIQLKPLFTSPNLDKYLRHLKPRSVDDKDVCDISKWNHFFPLDPTIPQYQEKNAEKFNITRDWKECWQRKYKR